MNKEKIEPIRIFEYIGEEDEFKEIEKKLPLYDNLNSDKMLLFIDLTRDRVWLWRGSNTTPNWIWRGSNTPMQSLEKSVFITIKDNYILKKFPDITARDLLILLQSIIRTIDEGNEPSDFKISIGLMDEQSYPEFKINNLLTLKLEDNKTYIYVKGKKFIQCIRLFLHIPPQKVNLYDKIESIDEATEIFDKFLYENIVLEGEFLKLVKDHNFTITPEEEFWGHCSNLQAWVEHEYDTRLLRSNLSFPLLKKLSDAGDQFALIRFKEEIITRLKGGYLPVIRYLIEENYLQYLSPEDLRDVRKKFSRTYTPNILKLVKRGSKRSSRDYSKIRGLKNLLHIEHIINQMNPKDFVVELASLDFTFLDFFISPNIENTEVYFKNLLERLREGLKSEDSFFFKATEHFIKRIIQYLFHLLPSKRKIKRPQYLSPEIHKSNMVSISWLLERIYEEEAEGIILKNIASLSERYFYEDPKLKGQADSITDVTSFKNFLNSFLKVIESQL